MNRGKGREIVGDEEGERRKGRGKEKREGERERGREMEFAKGERERRYLTYQVTYHMKKNETQ